MQTTDKEWIQLKGKFHLNDYTTKVVIFIEGPPAGTDILVNGFFLKHAEKVPPSSRPTIEVS